jgi:hypothetical protein
MEAVLLSDTSLNVYQTIRRHFQDDCTSNPNIIGCCPAQARLQLSSCHELKLNSVGFVRERTIPTERPPLVNEVRANFCGYRCRVVSATDSHGR